LAEATRKVAGLASDSAATSAAGANTAFSFMVASLLRIGL
jgi:hypothetical protein